MKLRRPKYGYVAALSRGRYDSFSHFRVARRLKIGSSKQPLFYRRQLRGAGNAEIRDCIEADAKAALERPLVSVYDKTGCASSGEKADYYSAAAYWWPNPDTEDGLPYIRHDCDRNPDTELYSAASRQYDRTSLQYLIDGVVALTLAGGEAHHARAADMLRHWFLEPATAMNPTLQFAQVRPGKDNDNGAPSGLIEARDLALLPDMIRRLEQGGALTNADVQGLKAWFAALLEWMQTSKQGQKEQRSNNNHGTNNDLLCLALANFCEDRGLLKAYAARALARVEEQFSSDGDQPEEAARPHVLHYCTYNLQSWLLMERVLAQIEVNTELLQSRLAVAAAHLWRRYLADAEQAAREDFTVTRFVPILSSIQRFGARPWSGEALAHPALAAPPVSFHPFTGIPPYWRLMFAAD